MLLLLAPSAFAAITTTALTGRVTSDGRPVANARITAASKSLLHPRQTTTGPSGIYWLEALPPGEYEITFSARGLQTIIRRAVVQFARVSRADATLEPSEDEESVTSTATTISVVDNTTITTHRTAEMLERFPAYGNIFGVLYAAPGLIGFAGPPEVDDVVWRESMLPAETIDEAAFIRGAQPIEYARGDGTMLLGRTRTGGEELTISLRDTISSLRWFDATLPPQFENDDIEHFLESTSGGRIVRDRLWFFAAGWGGDRADEFSYDQEGYLFKLNAQLGARQSVMASHAEGHRAPSFAELQSAATILRHTGQWGSHATTQLLLARTRDEIRFPSGFPLFTSSVDSVSFKGTWFRSTSFGDHVWSAGTTIEDDGKRFLFLTDRWSLRRWTVNAGAGHETAGRDFPPAGNPPLEYDSSSVSGQIAAAYDLRGNGRHALTASATRYADPAFANVDEFTLGYTVALGSSGALRAHGIRRDYAQIKYTSAQIDGSYRLFDRFELAGNYTYTDFTAGFVEPLTNTHAANAWFNMELPLGAHAFGFTVVERYGSGTQSFSDQSTLTTDAALRYHVPIRRVTATLAADVENVFNQETGSSVRPRLYRFWIRARL